MFDVQTIVETGGLLLIAAILFAEAGLLVGFVLPGETLLIAAGVYAAQNDQSLVLLISVVALASILGYQVGYKIGEKAGPRFFKRKDGILFRKEYIDKTENLVKKYGTKAILLARFLTVIRTLVPLMAGMGKMDKKRFLTLNIIGGFLWSAVIVMAGYWIGSKVANIDHYLLPLIIVGMVVTSGGVLVGLLKDPVKRQQLVASLRTEMSYLFKRNSK